MWFLDPVRVAALRTGPGRVVTAVRTSATKFQIDHFRAVCDYSGAQPETLGLTRPADVALPPLAFDPATDLYGPMLFHGPRFKLVESVHRTGAQHVTGRLLAGTGSSWFGRYLPDRLLLGDPAARDAAYGRWPWDPPLPRDVMGFPRNFLFVADH